MICVAGAPDQMDNSELIAQLDASVATFRTQTFASTTKRTYSTHMRTYMAFNNLMHIASAPISRAKLARYIAYLASRLSYNSIKQYINIVRLIHIESGLANPLDVSWYIKSLMMGCKRVLGSTSKPKLAMTVDLLQ